MKKRHFIYLGLTAILSLGLEIAHATDQYYCTPEPNTTTYCCDSSVTTCNDNNYDMDIPFGSGSNTGKHEVGGDGTFYMQVNCNNNGSLMSSEVGKSGGTIDCTLDGGGVGAGYNYVKYMCHNSSLDSGHVWINTAGCSA